MKSSSLTCLENSKNKIGVDVKITLLLFFLLEIFTAGQILSPKLSSTMQSKSLAIFEKF